MMERMLVLPLPLRPISSTFLNSRLILRSSAAAQFSSCTEQLCRALYLTSQTACCRPVTPCQARGVRAAAFGMRQQCGRQVVEPSCSSDCVRLGGPATCMRRAFSAASPRPSSSASGTPSRYLGQQLNRTAFRSHHQQATTSLTTRMSLLL
jgi:hypothetical protein